MANVKIGDSSAGMYLWIAAVVAVFLAVIWCFTSGPCSGDGSAPDTPPPADAPSGVGAAISDAIDSTLQYTTSEGNTGNGLQYGP